MRDNMKRVIGLLCTFSMVFTTPASLVWAEEPAMVVGSQMIVGQQPEEGTGTSTTVSAGEAAAQSSDRTDGSGDGIHAEDGGQKITGINAEDEGQKITGLNTEGGEGNEAGIGEAIETEAPVAPGGGPQIAAPSAVLMEASTGQVIFEKDADTKRSPASVTKVMTLILIFDALESGKIKMTDEVVTSAHAKSMGGSQVFLEEGEVQTVETLIKCIVIASGNDASVAMAEYIAGTEPEFVNMMNERAKGLGMTNTNFEDCCGLTESPTHVTTARDIAIMSRELINRYPQIHNYSTIWMENITHVTKQGTKEFGLSNTNKLLKMATNFTVTGLKTGSTSIAKYCLSATAEKDGVRLIAAVMAAPDFKVRFADAQTMLNYGYANCKLYEDQEKLPLPLMQVKNGVEETVPLKYNGNFSYLSLKGDDLSAIQKELVLEEMLEAPIEPGMRAGALKYTLNGTALGEVPIITDGTIREAGFKDYLKKLLNAWWMGGVKTKTDTAQTENLTESQEQRQPQEQTQPQSGMKTEPQTEPQTQPQPQAEIRKAS